MKETHYFYAPDVLTTQELPEEEALHATRVLRMCPGDEITITDGRGGLHEAVITATSKRSCSVAVKTSVQVEPLLKAGVHLAIAPTKNIDRMEWLAEKATEIGISELSFVNCRFSERTSIKGERIERIIVSAMKQSHKAEKPQMNEMVNFSEFVRNHTEGDRYICHCYDQEDLGEKPLLRDVLTSGNDAIVMVGPEGDFSVEEVKAAIEAGFRPVSLGKSRLRTETAGLVAVHLMNLCNMN